MSTDADETVADLHRLFSGLSRLASRMRLRNAMHPGIRNLAQTDAWLLSHLAATGPARMSALAEWQAVDRSTMTAQVKRLERAGLARRHTDPTDRRASIVALTREGKAACDEIRRFADTLTNWYVRRSRDRFWEGQEAHPEAFDTLYTVLEVLTRVSAPLLPYISEVIWRGLTGERSVHLTDFPRAEEFPADADLVAAMDATRAVCSAASSVRKARKLRNRLPLPKLTVAMPNADALRDFAPVIRDEVNVKEIDLTSDVDAAGSFEVVVNAKAAGPQLGRDVQRAIKNVKAGNYVREGENVVVDGDIVLTPELYTERLVAEDPDSTARVESSDGTVGLVVLDTHVTEELEAEGWAADVIRGLQDARKQAGLEVSDRIAVRLSVPADRAEWAERHADHIAAETLATDFAVVTDALDGAVPVIDGVTVTVAKQ